jgi:hypothetical protein
MKPGTSQAMKWTWLQKAQGPTREDDELWGPEQEMFNLVGQGALSKPRRMMLRAHMQKGEDSGRIISKDGCKMG